MLSAIGLAGFPTRVSEFAGVPLNAAAAIALMVAGGLLVRHVGSARAPVDSTNGNEVLH